jgi:hypothetical protein
MKIKLTKTLPIRNGKFKKGMIFEIFDHVGEGTPSERFFFRVPNEISAMAYFHEVEVLDKNVPV